MDPIAEGDRDDEVEGASAAAAELASQGAAGMARATRKLVVLVLIVLAVLVVTYLTPLGRYLRDLQSLKRDFAGSEAWLFVGIPVATALLMAVGLPRLLFCALAGFLIGFWKGFVLSYAGSVAGAYITFIVARALGREWVELKLRDRARLRELVGQPGIVTVFWIRQLPITSAAISLALGMSGVGHGVYLAGSALGFLPAAIVATLIGSGLGQESATTSLIQIGLALAGTAFTVVALLRFRPRAMRRRPAG